MNLPPLDWFILIVLVVGLIRGYKVGAVRQIASLAGIVLAVLLAVQFMHPVGAVIGTRLGLSPAVGPIVGFVAVFAGVQLVVFALSRMLEDVLDTLSLTVVNRAAGGALGGFKAALLLSVLFLVLSGVELPDDESRHKSVLYPPVARTLPETLEAASPYLPAARRAVEAFGRRVESQLHPQARRSANDRPE